MMLNPHVASESLTPWILYLIGNSAWLVHSYGRDWPLFWLSCFYFLWDALILASRYSPNLFDFALPIINSLGVIP
jgi:hypothetical protein